MPLFFLWLSWGFLGVPLPYYRLLPLTAAHRACGEVGFVCLGNAQGSIRRLCGDFIALKFLDTVRLYFFALTVVYSCTYRSGCNDRRGGCSLISEQGCSEVVELTVPTTLAARMWKRGLGLYI